MHHRRSFRTLSNVNEIQKGLLHGQVHLHADKHTVQNVAMTITTVLEEAVSRMQLQLHSLPMKRWRKRNLRVEIGTCRMQKSTPDKFRQMKWQEAGWRTVAAEGPPASARSFTRSLRSGSKWS